MKDFYLLLKIFIQQHFGVLSLSPSYLKLKFIHCTNMSFSTILKLHETESHRDTEKLLMQTLGLLEFFKGIYLLGTEQG